MPAAALSKFYWGFLFIMVDFRLNGIDLLPDIVGFILFAVGFGLLAAESDYFNQARKLNMVMIILSIFSIYEAPAQDGGIHIAPDWPLGLIIGICSLVFTLLVVYNLFMGVRELAERAGRHELAAEAEQRWKQFLILQVAGAGAFLIIFIPPLAFIYIISLFVASIILTVLIMGFIKRCEQSL